MSDKHMADSIPAAFLDCPHKALLEIKGQAGQTDALEFSINRRLATYREAVIQRYQQSADESRRPDVKWIGFNRSPAGEQLLATEVAANSEIIAESQGNGANHIPLLFVPVEKISKQHKLLLAFSANILSKAGHKVSPHGKIIHGHDGRTTRVQLNKLHREMEKALDTIKRIAEGTHSPPLILNSHCKVCRFSDHCRAKAIEKDDLSLISSISQKEILKLQKKGIFSVTQLSHTYRPRRRRRKTESPEKHSHALKALAIREKKIYVTPADKPQLGRVRVFFDVEGLPDTNFYYLIGAKVVDGANESIHSFWADNPADEEKIWKEFLSVLVPLDNFSLLHFSGYESEFVSRMLKRHGTIAGITADRLRVASINILTFCHLNIYFPTYSNGLKDLATYLKFQWTHPGSSGLDSIHWRQQWETFNDDALKETLLRYNLDDCEALNLLTKTVLEILEHGTKNQEPVTTANSVPISSPYKLGPTSFLLPEFSQINKCAYFNYQRSKVYWRTDSNIKRSLRRAHKQRHRHQRVNKVIRFKMPRYCPACRSIKIHKDHNYERIIYDLRFTPSGVKKWIVKLITLWFECRKCERYFLPQEYVVTVSKIMGHDLIGNGKAVPFPGTLRQNNYGNMQRYGHGFLAWAVYQSIALRQPGTNVARSLNDIFGFGLNPNNGGFVLKLKERAEGFYAEAYLDLIRSLRSGHLVHVDETKVNLKDTTGYVWVFTNLETVLYVYSDSREGEILSETLKDFNGVLISDFYAAYDSLPCFQQRCLIHLIRDLNDDLLKNQFDAEFKDLVEAFGRLLRPIIRTVDAHGLKALFLQKHKGDVNKFFEWCLAKNYSSELARKCQTRFKKNRDRLFTFLDYDGVPWNNNNAENAIKAFAALRRSIDGLATERGIRTTLKLLSIAQTLRNKNISFLDFLKSRKRSLTEYTTEADDSPQKNSGKLMGGRRRLQEADSGKNSSELTAVRKYAEDATRHQEVHPVTCGGEPIWS